MNNTQKHQEILSEIAELQKLSKQDREKKILEMHAEAMRDMPDQLRQAIERNPIHEAINTRTGKKISMVIDIETGRAREID